MKHSYLFVLFVVLMMPATSFARDWKAGLMVGIGLTSVDDPAGSTEIKADINYLNGIATIPFKRDRRIFTHIFYQDFDLNNSNNKISSSVKSLGINASYQWLLRFSRDWKPWIGAGLGFSQDDFTSRKKLDGDGFVIQRFADREDNAVNLIINASTKLTTWKMFDLGAHVQIDIPISGDITRFNIFGTVLF